MEIQALRTVLIVAQHGSLAGAARSLDLDASTVSRIVANVERELGLRLFQRSTRRLSITEEGEAYLRRIAPLVEELEAACEASRSHRLSPQGTLRLTASVAFAHECIVPLLPALQATYPAISVDLLATDANVDLLADGVDLAIRLAAAPEGDLISTKLMPTRYRVVAAPAFVAQHGPVAHPRDLADLPCVRFSLPEFRDRWRFRQGDEPAFETPVGGKTLISNALSLRQAVRHGMGPGLLADWLVRRDLHEGRLVDLFPAFACAATSFDTGAYALYPSRTYLPQKVRVALDFFRARLSAGAWDHAGSCG